MLLAMLIAAGHKCRALHIINKRVKLVV